MKLAASSSDSLAGKARDTHPALGLFRDGALRHGATALAYLATWAFLLVRMTYQAVAYPDASASEALAQLGLFGEALAFVLGWAAVTANSPFLFGRDAAEFYGSLPLGRARLFLASLAAAVVPLLADVGILAVLLLALSGPSGLTLVDIGQWAALQTLMLIAFCGTASACSQLAGRPAIALIVYLMANFYALVVRWGVWALASVAMPTLVMGDITSIAMTSPVYILARQLLGGTYDSGGLWPYLVTFSIVGVALMPLSCLLLCRRNLERAGEAFAFRWAHTVITVLFCVGAAVGMTLIVSGSLFGYLGSGGYLYANSPVTGPMLAGMVITWTLVIALVSEAIMGRGVRAIRDHAPTVIASVVLGLVVALVATLDLTGAQRYVPQASDVQSATATCLGTLTLEDEDAISELTDMHKALIDTSQEESSGSADYVGTTVYLRYQMRDGSVVSRRYDIEQPVEGTPQTGTRGYAMQQFLNSEAVGRQLMSTLEDALSTNAGRERVTLDPVGGTGDTSIQVRSDYLPGLLEALEADIQEHGAGVMLSSDARADTHGNAILDYDAVVSVLGPFTSASQNMMCLDLSEEGTPQTHEWVVEHYDTELVSDGSSSDTDV